MTAPTYTQQQTPHLFGQTPGYDPFNPFGTSPHSSFGGFGGFGGAFGGGLGQQPGQQWGQQWGQQSGQPVGDLYTLVWQLLGYAQQSIQLAQQIVIQSVQQQTQYPMSNQNQWQSPFGPRGFQRQPMAW